MCSGNERVSLSVFWEWEGKSLCSGNGRVSLCVFWEREGKSLCVLGTGG